MKLTVKHGVRSKKKSVKVFFQCAVVTVDLCFSRVKILNH